ncbi:redoxin domain-containing protein [Nesterenkonia jeotgali]|uniref:Peroxiredoxin n=1 Tax=Nesterenkonia jeotgali TaxID=317018 RepID=A0A839FFW8_9MICC|nr:redoxin domain-containing protein [Nesterenkonia jeotgali]MBA8920588.1 peroxiredoxin [Nesterenkonia jeotgali]
MTGSRLPRIGEPAPEFSGRTQHGEVLELDQLRGTPVLLLFYPFAFSRVCDSELQALAARRGSIRETSARVLAISCDPIHSLRAYAEMLRSEHRADPASDSDPASRAGELSFDLVSDFWPHGEIAQRYGAFDPVTGAAQRISFLLDSELRLAKVDSVPATQTRDLDATLAQLARLG